VSGFWRSDGPLTSSPAKARIETIMLTEKTIIQAKPKEKIYRLSSFG
jgi:hypothetical protein